ncbi:MAG: molecular chaperone HtpG [Lachnospiraceae bacterium]|nr:molecular chaperone HtpG [Lachnospiraceae bacterium]
MKEQGNLSINSDNFLPIIKKWLYTDKDIFIRELISNGCDAVNKLQKLMGMGEAPHIKADEKFYISVVVDEENSTIEITDNGIGMTADEIKKYINQIAFSGATDFISKYQDKMDEGSQIIGHFGLGFYSAYMVADKVEINSLSYKEGAEAAKWICEGGVEFEMDASDKTDRGTTITLYIGEDGKEFLDKYTLRAAIDKYCSFMPVEIYYDYIRKPQPVAEGNEKEEETTPDEPVLINETTPLWLRQPNELTDEDYIKFYHKVFFDMNDPLFWIHLNMDYPFRLKGILYFPKIINQTDTLDGEVKLYCNQVYIADNIKEVVPEFLLLLKGVMDCPDMPLNVSRSTLQNDGYSGKMSNYVSKKVADKLVKLFKNEREHYEKIWDDISMFIKYGCVKEEKFYDKMKSALIYKTFSDKYQTLDEFIADNKDITGDTIYYANDVSQQSQYIKLFKEQGMDAFILNSEIDRPFVTILEMKEDGNITLLRVDSELSDNMKESDENASEAEKEAAARTNDEVQNLFRGILDKQELFVKVEPLKASSVSGMLLVSEEARRMAEIQKIYRERGQGQIADMFGNIKPDVTLVLNSNNSLVKGFLKLKDNMEKKDVTELICRQLFDLAQISQKALEPDDMSAFIDRSNKILELLMENM